LTQVATLTGGEFGAGLYPVHTTKFNMSQGRLQGVTCGYYAE
jgi:hypothetical protein